MNNTKSKCCGAEMNWQMDGTILICTKCDKDCDIPTKVATDTNVATKPEESREWAEEFEKNFVPKHPKFKDMPDWLKTLEGTTANYTTLLEYIRSLLLSKETEIREKSWKEFVARIDNIMGEFGDRPEFPGILDEHLHGGQDVEY